MDEPWGHYAKWNELDRERQILYYLTKKCIQKQKKKKTHKTELTHIENRLARGGTVREWSGNVGGRNE